MVILEWENFINPIITTFSNYFVVLCIASLSRKKKTTTKTIFSYCHHYCLKIIYINALSKQKSHLGFLNWLENIDQQIECCMKIDYNQTLNWFSNLTIVVHDNERVKSINLNFTELQLNHTESLKSIGQQPHHNSEGVELLPSHPLVLDSEFFLLLDWLHYQG